MFSLRLRGVCEESFTYGVVAICGGGIWYRKASLEGFALSFLAGLIYFYGMEAANCNSA